MVRQFLVLQFPAYQTMVTCKGYLPPPVHRSLGKRKQWLMSSQPAYCMNKVNKVLLDSITTLYRCYSLRMSLWNAVTPTSFSHPNIRESASVRDGYIDKGLACGLWQCIFIVCTSEILLIIQAGREPRLHTSSRSHI
jgi:hypothetical protein